MSNSEGTGLERVTFELPVEAGATTSVAVAGDFNDWSVTSHQMRRRDDGGFEISLDVPRGHAYSYRYWVDDERWENDWSADGYTPNVYGGENSVLDLRPSSPRLRQAASASVAPPAVGSPSLDEDDSIERPPDTVKAAADEPPSTQRTEQGVRRRDR